MQEIRGIPIIEIEYFWATSHTLSFSCDKLPELADVYDKIELGFSIEDDAIICEPISIIIWGVSNNYNLIFRYKENYIVLLEIIYKLSIEEQFDLLEQAYEIHKRFKSHGLTVCFRHVVYCPIIGYRIALSRADIGKDYTLDLIFLPFAALKEKNYSIHNTLLWHKMRPLFAAVAARQTRLTYDALWLIGQY